MQPQALGELHAAIEAKDTTWLNAVPPAFFPVLLSGSCLDLALAQYWLNAVPLLSSQCCFLSPALI